MKKFLDVLALILLTPFVYPVYMCIAFKNGDKEYWELTKYYFKSLLK